jgi:hypothetical protein
MRIAEHVNVQLHPEFAFMDQHLMLRPIARIDFLPQSAWLSTEFETDLNVHLMKIVANDFLPHASNLQHICLKIQRYYPRFLTARDRVLKGMEVERSGRVSGE